MPACDAPVMQLESRKLCLSILFGTRKNKVYCLADPIAQVPDLIQLESRKKFISMLGNPRPQTVEFALPVEQPHDSR